jgi:hypothetical protein
MDNIAQLFKKCRLVDLNVVGDSPTKFIVPGHRCGKEMVNGLTIIIEWVKWRVIHGDFLTQTGGFNCGPIACLKVMELFQRIDLESSQKCYEKGRIRAVVLDEWELLVDTCDRDRKLHVLDTRTEDTSVAKSERSSLDYGYSSDTDNGETINGNDSSTDLSTNKAASGECIKVNCSAFKFSAGEKAPHLGSVEEYKQKKGDDQECDTIGEVGQMCNKVGVTKYAHGRTIRRVLSYGSRHRSIHLRKNRARNPIQSGYSNRMTIRVPRKVRTFLGNSRM